jgi:hypothetical protein
MTAEDGLDNCQAQSISGIVRGIPAAIEPFKQMSLIFEGDFNGWIILDNQDPLRLHSSILPGDF